LQTPSLILFIYGVLVLLGGIMGYVQAQSVPSLIAGVVSGILLLGAGWALQNGQRWGFLLGVVVTVGLLLFFGGRFAQSRAIMPGGLMTILSLGVLIALLLTGRGR
jgi:uncharacterized membrane protein (UPF0136 family)